MKRFLTVLFLMIMIPYVTTLAWTGRLGDGDITGLSGEEGPRVIVAQNQREASLSVEEFLIHVLAGQIPAEYGKETIKAQAVLARTYIYRELDGADSIYEEALDMDALSRSQMEKLWGSRDFAKNYEKLTEAIEETRGLFLTYEGAPIEPFFCRAGSGSTRSGGEEYPYLKEAQSPGDLKADGFLSLAVFLPRTMADKINSIPGAVSVEASSLPEEIQIVERDGAGYVKKVQIGQKTYSGEEVQYALGLSSSCYSFEEADGKIRVTCKGIGHGYGFSQAGANALEADGYDFKELLNYYFQNVEIANY